MYSSACQRVQRLTRLPTLALPATAATFGLRKCGHHAGDGIGSDDGIGVDADEKFGIADVLQSKVQRLSLAAVGLGENQYFAGGFFGGKRTAGDFQSAILGPVVDDDHAQIGIVGIERALNGAFDDLLLVIRGNQHRDLGPVGRNLLGRSIDMGAETVKDGEHADRNQAAGHEDVTEEEDDA